jgi:PiT family inorganic phosphate transporter
MFHFFESINFGHFPYAALSATVWLLILLALTFDFLNGLHDAANSVATVVSTRVLSPRAAVLWAAFFNFVAFVVFPLKVAGTIQGDVISQAVISNHVIASTLAAACGWNLLTWYCGLPTSSSHALIGGMVGAALAAFVGGTPGLEQVRWPQIFSSEAPLLKWHGLGLIVGFIVLAPIIGGGLGTAIALIVTWLCWRSTPRRVDALFRRCQLLSAAFFSLGHGGNDAQKTMGIIFVLLVAASKAHDIDPPKVVPTEVVLACHLAMGLGTMFGGWRIVKTMGQRIIRLRPIDGFCAESAAALTLAATTLIRGIPISTTHTITGAIVGVGSLKRLSAVRWGVAGQVVWAWVLTIPGSAALAAISWWLLRGVF